MGGDCVNFPISRSVACELLCQPANGAHMPVRILVGNCVLRLLALGSVYNRIHFVEWQIAMQQDNSPSRNWIHSCKSKNGKSRV